MTLTPPETPLMVIEIKNFKEYPRLSEETTCFTADLYIDGKKVGLVENTGKGGCTDYSANSAVNNEIIRAAEAYCLLLPAKINPAKPDWGIKEPFETPMNLEAFIDDLVDAAIREKDNAKMYKCMLTGLVIGNPDDLSVYSFMSFKTPLTEFMSTPRGLAILKNDIVKLKAKLKSGEKILNNNIPSEILAVTELVEVPAAPPVTVPSAKMKKLMLTNIVLGNPSDLTRYRNLDLKMPIADMLKDPTSATRLKLAVANVKRQLNPGEKILNENIPTDILNIEPAIKR